MLPAPPGDPPPNPLIGKRILDFDVIGTLGHGGMATVFKARHALTGQLVAIKVVPPSLDEEPNDGRKRFVEEAKVLARLDHANIVGLNNFTEDAERNLCLVMQFVEGTTLERRIESEERMAAAEVVRVTLEVLAALDYAHRQGVVHRDVKPANIMIRPDGGVRVADFGIAKIVGSAGITRVGQTVGTALYMSPEQVLNQGVEFRSDLYSLGITMYEALAGFPPFDGPTSIDVLEKQLSEEAKPLRAAGVAVSAELEAVVQRCLAKRPDDRFADAATMRKALARVPENAQESSRMVRMAELESVRRQSRLYLFVAAAAVLLAGVVGAVLFLHRQRGH